MATCQGTPYTRLQGVTSMFVRRTSVVPVDAARTAERIRLWRQHYCGGVVDQILTTMFTPLSAGQRIAATVDGSTVLFEPSWFALDNVVLIFHRPNTQTLRVAFYDQSTGMFLPAITTLSMSERGKLGSGRRRDRQAYLAELIKTAREGHSASSARVPVGA